MPEQQTPPRPEQPKPPRAIRWVVDLESQRIVPEEAAPTREAARNN